jgi:uncharacterized protein DUF3786
MRTAEVFENNYQGYCEQIAKLDFASIHANLGADLDRDRLLVRFFNRRYIVSKEGMHDAEGKRPGYLISVILAKYILLCPGVIHEEPEWVSFKDFKSDSYLSTVTAFSTKAETAIKKHFSGRPNDLKTACEKLGGSQHSMDASYDVAMRFIALPRISILLLFNDQDDGFPAYAKFLYQKHAEYYLDPESLGMTGIFLAESLKRKALR